MLTAKRANEIFAYDPVTGELTFKATGKRAGWLNGNGYLRVGVEGAQQYVHRIIWLMRTGESPPKVDHKNHDTVDNRWANLRAATDQESVRNRRMYRNNASGHKGVHREKHTPKWRVQIGVGYRQKHIGYYDTAEEAAHAYSVAACQLHGEFAST